CHSLCDPMLGCSGPEADNCERCVYARLHLHGPCVEACPEGSFLDVNSRLCEMCTEPCLKCRGPDTASECSSCIAGFLLIPELGSCQRQCPQRYYTATHQKVCIRCVNHCKSCPESPDRCLACNDGFESLQDGSVCSAHCQGNEFRNSLLQCSGCDQSCSGCFGPSAAECVECAAGYVSQVNECRRNCSSGFHLDTDSASCLR
ncbi:hypothetical protein CAPTEDRAFT_106129, partial [Capitella teleta]